MLSTAPIAPAIYVRWSTEEQGSGTTLEEQRQTCLAFLRDRGWSVREDLIFIDDGYSAGSLERPAMLKLRRAVHAGAVDAVVVYKLDRLTRNIVDAVELVLKEWEGRCALVSVTQSSIDTTTPMGRQFFTLMASFAEFEREMIRDRTLSGKKRRAMQGRNPGFRPPYGYMTGDAPGSVVVDEERAAIVRRIFEEFTSGISMIEIAKRLNLEGVPIPGEARGWQDRTIRYMLQNPLYVGRLEYGRSSINSPQKRAVAGAYKTHYMTPRYAVVDDAVPPIVSPGLWKTAQDVMKERRRSTGFASRAQSSQYLLTGLLRCKCGAACAGTTAREGHQYYRCRAGALECNSTLIRVDMLDKAVLEIVRRQLRVQMTEGILQAAAARVEGARKGVEAKAAGLKSTLATIEKQREKVRQDYLSGEIGGRAYTEMVSDMDQREADARVALREAERLLANPEAIEAETAFTLSNVDQVLGDAWEQMAMSQKKQALRCLVPRLVAFRAKGSDDLDLDITVVTPEAEEPAVKAYHLVHGRSREMYGALTD